MLRLPLEPLGPLGNDSSAVGRQVCFQLVASLSLNISMSNNRSNIRSSAPVGGFISDNEERATKCRIFTVFDFGMYHICLHDLYTFTRAHRHKQKEIDIAFNLNLHHPERTHLVAPSTSTRSQPYQVVASICSGCKLRPIAFASGRKAHLVRPVLSMAMASSKSPW